jgi:hypothetical protein
VNSLGVQITGLSAPAPITITGGTYSVNGGAFTAAAGTIPNNATLQLNTTTAAAPSTPVTVTVTINGVVGTWVVTTGAPSGRPDPYMIVARTNQPFNALVISDVLTPTGFNIPIQVTIAAPGEISVNNGPFTAGPSTLNPGQTVRFRLRSATVGNTAVSAQVAIGGVGGTYSVTTEPPDSIPDQCSFAPLSNLPPGQTTYTSTECILTGFNTPFGGSFSDSLGGPPAAGGFFGSQVTPGGNVGIATILLNGAPYTLTTTVRPGDRVSLQYNTQFLSFGQSVAVGLSYNGPANWTANWNISIRAQDTSADSFAFNDGSSCETPVSTVQPTFQSNLVTLSGFDGPLTLTVTNLNINGTGPIGIGTFYLDFTNPTQPTCNLNNSVGLNSCTAQVNPGQQIRFRWFNPVGTATASNKVIASVSVGGQTATMRIRCPFL